MKGIAKLILSSKYLQERIYDPKEYPSLAHELRRFADDIEDGVYEDVNYVSHSDDMNGVFYEPEVMPRNHYSMMVNGRNRQFAVSANYKVRPTKRAADEKPASASLLQKLWAVFRR